MLKSYLNQNAARIMNISEDNLYVEYSCHIDSRKCKEKARNQKNQAVSGKIAEFGIKK